MRFTGIMFFSNRKPNPICWLVNERTFVLRLFPIVVRCVVRRNQTILGCNDSGISHPTVWRHRPRYPFHRILFLLYATVYLKNLDMYNHSWFSLSLLNHETACIELNAEFDNIKLWTTLNKPNINISKTRDNFQMACYRASFRPSIVWFLLAGIKQRDGVKLLGIIR